MENDKFWQKNSDWEENNTSEDNIEMTDEDNDNLNSNAFNILIKIAQNFKNFDSHKFAYFWGLKLSDWQKQKYVDKKCKLIISIKGFLSFITGFFFTKLLDIQKISITCDFSQSSFSFTKLSCISYVNSNCSTFNLIQYTNLISKINQKCFNAIQNQKKN